MSFIHTPLRGAVVALIGLASATALALESASTATTLDADQMYYSVDRPFIEGKTVELRGAFSWDVANPYHSILGGQVEALYLLGPSWAVGIGGVGYGTSLRTSALRLEQELARNGYRVAYVPPSYAVRAVVRFTPVHGLLNFMASRVGQGDLSVLFRGGLAGYDGNRRGPSFGTGLEATLGLTKTFGFQAALTWDWERPGELPWGSRVSFFAGPVVRL
jgi:hypothetical protein